MAVRKRNNRWHYDVQVRGVRYRGSIPEAMNKAQAERAEARIKLDIFEQKFGDGISRNLAEFVANVYEPSAKAKRSYKTGEVTHIRTVAAYFKSYRLADISPMAVERFKRERMAAPTGRGDKRRRPASVNRELACLSRICSIAVDNGLLKANPCSKVKRLREDNIRTRYLTDEEEAQLMDGIGTRFERLRPIIILALNTGMRQGEIFNLTWAKVDWQRGLIMVSNTKNATDRPIPMNETVKDLLLGMWREREGERVFNGCLGAVGHAFRKLVLSVKLRDFHFHDLRHTFATRLAPHTDAFTLAALLGHKTLAMVSRYTHPTDEAKRRAVAVLSNLSQSGVTIEFSRSKAQAV